MHDPIKGHWEAIKWILRYINDTKDVGLVLEKGSTCKQKYIGYIDSNYTGDLDKHRFITGYVCTLAQAPESWRFIL